MANTSGGRDDKAITANAPAAVINPATSTRVSDDLIATYCYVHKGLPVLALGATSTANNKTYSVTLPRYWRHCLRCNGLGHHVAWCMETPAPKTPINGHNNVRAVYAPPSSPSGMMHAKNGSPIVWSSASPPLHTSPTAPRLPTPMPASLRTLPPGAPDVHRDSPTNGHIYVGSRLPSARALAHPTDTHAGRVLAVATDLFGVEHSTAHLDTGTN